MTDRSPVNMAKLLNGHFLSPPNDNDGPPHRLRTQSIFGLGSIFVLCRYAPSNDCFLRRPIETTKKSRWKRDDALGRWWVRKKANVCVFLLPTSAAAPTNRKGSHTEGTEGEECAVSRELRTTNKPTVVMPSSPSLLYWDLWPLFWVLGVCCIRNVSKFSKSRF